MGPSKFLGNNLIEEYPHNRRTTKTNNEKVFGYIFFEDTVAYFFSRKINNIGRIIISFVYIILIKSKQNYDRNCRIFKK